VPVRMDSWARISPVIPSRTLLSVERMGPSNSGPPDHLLADLSSLARLSVLGSQAGSALQLNERFIDRSEANLRRASVTILKEATAPVKTTHHTGSRSRINGPRLRHPKQSQGNLQREAPPEPESGFKAYHAITALP